MGEYLNQWQLLYTQLEESGEKWQDTKKRDQFLKGTQLERDHPLQIIKVGLDGRVNLTYTEALETIERVARKGTDDAGSASR